MYTDELRLFIKSDNNELKKILLEIVSDIKFDKKINIYEKDDINEIKNIKPDFIILDLKNLGQYIKEIKNIKEVYRYLDNRIIVAIDNKDREGLIKIINEGINEFIFKPYIKEEIILRISNFIKYISALKTSKGKEIQFNALLNNTPYMAWLKDKDSNYIMANEDFKVHSGKSMNEIYGKDDKFVWDGKIGENCRLYDLQVMNERKQIVFNEVIPGKKGYREFNIHKSPVVDEFNDVIGTIGVARDITEVKNKDNQLRIIIENIPFVVVFKDINGIILEVSSNVSNLYNVDRKKLIGTNGEHLKGIKIPEEFFELENLENKQVIENKEKMNFQRKLVWENKEYTLKIYKAPIFDIENKVSGIVTLIKDITEERKVQDKIKELAFTDSLTGLGNRRTLYKYLDELICGKNSFTIGFVDLDNFKTLNDVYGHNYGDEVLRIFAEKLRQICSESLVTRIGGDEFVVVWPNSIESEKIQNKIDSILWDIKILFNNYDKTKSLSASIGIVVNNKNEENTIEDLIGKGDFALYKAKEQGKNRCVFYSEKLKEENLFNIQIESDIRNIVKNDEVMLYYQPQFNCNKKLKGFEALFRWNNEKYNDIPIYKIIKIIENCKMMVTIGEAILEKAFIFSNNINKNRDNLITISINISPIQIMSKDFVERVKYIMKKTNVNPKTIVFEITETVLLDNLDENIKKLLQLKSLGLSLALDDFGTGYSSLSYLVKLPINELKIDRSFVVGMSSSEKYNRLIRHIIEISHTLSLQVVAEGVENNWELEILRSIGVDYIQGYLFGKPMKEEEAVLLVRS